MGCANSKKLPPSQMENNPKDKIDVPLNITNGCAMMGSVHYYMNEYIPQNGEYDWFGEGEECNYCSMEIGTEIRNCTNCESMSCCPILGKKGQYVRKRYLGDPIECCLTKKDVIEGKTCDPKYIDNTDNVCDATYQRFCTGMTKNIFEEQVCIDWCAKNQDVCNANKEKLCKTREGFNSIPGCMSWCMQNKGKCDEAVENYCDSHQDISDGGNTICACLKSKVTEYDNVPLCLDLDCMKYGYHTSAMIAALENGCNIIDCKVYNVIEGEGKVNVDPTQIQQNCGDKIIKPKVPDISSDTSQSFLQMIYQNILMLSIILILVVVFIMIAISGTVKIFSKKR